MRPATVLAKLQGGAAKSDAEAVTIQ